MGFLAVILMLAAAPAVTDTEIWNEGVEYYRAGDFTNAVRVLKPLMLSRSHGARAAEVVAAIELGRGNQEEAASAAQLALRANPQDEKANRNFTRATDGLLAKREERRLEAILKSAQGKDPGEMLRQGMYEARALMREAGGYTTNSAVRAVKLADALEKRALKNADLWIPLKQAIAQSVTNEEQAATIIQQVDEAMTRSRASAKGFADLDVSAYSAAADSEIDFNRFFKLTALPPAAIGEGLIAQSNAWLDVENVNNRQWQPEALELTRAFRAKFPLWARQYEQQAQSDTNMVPFTAEDQAKISALATELEKVQIECCESRLPPRQEEAIRIANEIIALLPKNQNQQGQGQGQGQPQAQPEQSPQDQQQNQQPDQSQDDSQDQQQDSQDQRQEDNPEQNPEEQEKAGAEGEEQEQPADKDVEAVMKKAQERSDEHEADKKARMRKAPLPPNERDW